MTTKAKTKQVKAKKDSTIVFTVNNNNKGCRYNLPINIPLLISCCRSSCFYYLFTFVLFFVLLNYLLLLFHTSMSSEKKHN